MKKLSGLLFILGLTTCFFCTSVDFNNPLDQNGTSYDAEKAKDDNGNGIPNIYEDDDGDGILNIDDPDSKLYVKDSIPPVFSTKGNDTVDIIRNDNVATSYTNFKNSVTATDNKDGNVTNLISIDPSFVSSFIDSVYKVTFSVSDIDGNTATIYRYCNVYQEKVLDVTGPDINISNDTVWLTVGDTIPLQYISAWDAGDDDTCAVVIESDAVDTSKAGTYTIVYSATDKSGNTSKATQFFIVEAGSNQDNVAPVITLTGKDTIYVTTYSEYSEPGYTATDNKDGTITSSVKVDKGSFVDGADPGLYTIKHTVSDAAGNSTSKYRYVCLNCGSLDITAPVLIISGSDTIYSISLRGSTRRVNATDAVDGDLTDSIKRTGTFDSTILGEYTLTYTVKDKSYNVATMHVTVTVIDANKDTTKPVITITGKNPDTVAVDSVNSYVDKGATAKDSGKTMSPAPVASGTVDLKTIGTYEITYTISDAAGNTATAVRTVVVKEVSKDLLIRYGVPTTAPLSALNKTYTSYTIEGTSSLVITGFTSLAFNWSGSQFYDFALNLTVSPYHLSLSSSANTLASTGPTLTLSGTGISGLDGTYYVTLSGTNLVWVKTTGEYAIVWAP